MARSASAAPYRTGRFSRPKGHPPQCPGSAGGRRGPSAAQFDGGTFATLYLSPRDYHPHPHALRWAAAAYGVCAWRCFLSTRRRRGPSPGLFARNERVVCWFESTWQGRRFEWALVLVGLPSRHGHCPGMAWSTTARAQAACASGTTRPKASTWEQGKRWAVLRWLHRGAALPARLGCSSWTLPLAGGPCGAHGAGAGVRWERLARRLARA